MAFYYFVFYFHNSILNNTQAKYGYLAGIIVPIDSLSLSTVGEYAGGLSYREYIGA
jgi:hypothetical protein